jgi:hypothetical protein
MKSVYLIKKYAKHKFLSPTIVPYVNPGLQDFRIEE